MTLWIIIGSIACLILIIFIIYILFKGSERTESGVLASRTPLRGNLNYKYDTNEMIKLVKMYGSMYMKHVKQNSYRFNDKNIYFDLLSNIKDVLLTKSGTIRVAATDFKTEIKFVVFNYIKQAIYKDSLANSENKSEYSFEVNYLNNVETENVYNKQINNDLYEYDTKKSATNYKDSQKSESIKVVSNDKFDSW